MSSKKKKPAKKPKSPSKPPAKKKPAGKKKAPGKKSGTPAKKKLPSKKKSSSSGSRKKKLDSASSAGSRSATSEGRRPRILPADTPFPVKFTARSNRAIEKYVYNKKSAIHGMGAFARIDIPDRKYLGSYEGIPTLDDGIYVLWVEHENGSWRGTDGKNELRYLNHSSSPNVEWDGRDLYSIRSIKKHEELTFHYGDEWEDVD